VDIILLDSRMDGSLAQCRRLLSVPHPPIMLVAAPNDDAWAADAICAGARGILALNAGADDLCSAVRAVLDGVIWAPRRAFSIILDRLLSGPETPRTNCLPEERLSEREREVLHHAAQGLGNKELAQCLEISEATVKAHMTHIFRKLGVRGRSELAAAYYGFATPSRYA